MVLQHHTVAAVQSLLVPVRWLGFGMPARLASHQMAAARARPSISSLMLPALLAVTSPDAQGARLFGFSGLGHLSGAPAELALYSRLRREDDANRIWQTSENLTDTSFPADERARPNLGSTDPGSHRPR